MPNCQVRAGFDCCPAEPGRVIIVACSCVALIAMARQARLRGGWGPMGHPNGSKCMLRPHAVRLICNTG